MSQYRTSDLASTATSTATSTALNSAALTEAPTVFSYTPTGRAIPASAPIRTPAPRPIAPSCTPSGRIVIAATAMSRAA